MTTLLGEAATDSQRAGRSDRALLISIQPRFAQAILDGTKTIELRRTKPRLAPNALALIYASTPTKALVGSATVAEIIQANPANLWDAHGEAAGVSAEEFGSYFEGATDAFGIRLTHVRSASSPVELGELREHGLEPPQSWRYLDRRVSEMLLADLSPSRPQPSQLRSDRPA